jgi:hypothetical protein
LNWVRSWKGQVDLGTKFVGDGIQQVSTAIMMADGKVYSANFFFDSTRVYGKSIQPSNVLEMKGFSRKETSESDLFDEFNKYLVIHESNSVWAKKKEPLLTLEQLTQLCSRRYQQIITHLWGLGNEIFAIEDVEFTNTDYAMVYFTFEARVQFPVKVCLTGHTVATLRNYGEFTGTYKEFVRGLCSLTGSVVWTE